jgi:hypothetical protein
MAKFVGKRFRASTVQESDILVPYESLLSSHIVRQPMHSAESICTNHTNSMELDEHMPLFLPFSVCMAILSSSIFLAHVGIVAMRRFLLLGFGILHKFPVLPSATSVLFKVSPTCRLKSNT